VIPGVAKLACCAAFAIASVACSDATGPSGQFFDACVGRVARNHIVLNVSPNHYAGSLAGSDIHAHLTLTPTEVYQAQCGSGTAEIVLSWPGRPADPAATYSGRWFPDRDQLWVDFTHPSGEFVIIRLFPGGTNGVWTMINATERTTIGGAVRLR
jgi:hypothetical protein